MQNWQLLAASKTIATYASQPDSINPIFQYNPHRGLINCAIFNHTNKVIASCGHDGKIALHSSVRPQDKLLQLTYHSPTEEPTSVNCCMFSAKSKYIAAGSTNSTVKVWEMKTSTKEPEPIKKLKGHTGAITSISWINNEQIVASASTCGDIFLHDVMTGAIRETFNSRHQQGINNIKVSDGEGFNRLAACTNSGSLMVWDLKSPKKPIYTYEDPNKNQITCLAISAIQPVLMVYSSMDCNFTFADINEKRTVRTVATEEPLTSVAFHNNGKTIAVGGLKGGLLLYDLRKLQAPVKRLSGHDTSIKSVSFADRIQKSEIKSGNTIKQSNVRSNVSELNSGKEIKAKTLTPTASINRISVEQEQKAAQSQMKGVVRNLTKKEEIEQPLRGEQNRVTVSAVTTIPSTMQYQPPPNINGHVADNTAVSNTQLKALEEKMTQQNLDLRLEMNDRFDSLHLQIIRQMQNMLRQMSDRLAASNMQKRELQQKVRALESENESLKKRTY